MLEQELRKLGHDIISSGSDPPSWNEVAALITVISQKVPPEDSLALLTMLSHLRASVERH